MSKRRDPPPLVQEKDYGASVSPIAAVILLVMGLALGLSCPVKAQDWAELEGVELEDVREVEQPPESWRKAYREVKHCLHNAAWNRVPFEELEIYMFREGTLEGRRVDVATWPERDKPWEIYVWDALTGSRALPHEFIHVLAPHLRHESKYFDMCITGTVEVYSE